MLMVRVSLHAINVLSCVLFFLHFWLLLSLSAGDHKLCYCPCSRQNEKWRKQYGLENLIDRDVLCSSFTVCEPLGLMSHLKKVGGVFEEKENRKMKQVPMLCKFHYGANIFLRELYKDYNGGEIGCITL